MNTNETDFDLPGELDTTLYDDLTEYFGTPPTLTEVSSRYGQIFDDWDNFGYLYTDLITDYEG